MENKVERSEEVKKEKSIKKEAEQVFELINDNIIQTSFKDQLMPFIESAVIRGTLITKDSQSDIEYIHQANAKIIELYAQIKKLESKLATAWSEGSAAMWNELQKHPYSSAVPNPVNPYNDGKLSPKEEERECGQSNQPGRIG